MHSLRTICVEGVDIPVAGFGHTAADKDSAIWSLLDILREECPELKLLFLGDKFVRSFDTHPKSIN